MDFKYSDRITIIDPMRGIASFAVMLFHLVKNLPGIDTDLGWLSLHRLGRLGVQVFFVISGFIIVYSLASKNYQIRDFGRFMAKRIIRIDPPYFVTIVLVLAVGFLLSDLSSSYSFTFTTRQVIGHIGYLNAFIGESWLLPVFWTLAIEFQFYIFIGVVFPLLQSKSKVSRFAFLAAFVMSGFLFDLESNASSKSFVFQHASLFAFGILAFWQHTLSITRKEYYSALFVVACCAAFCLGFSEMCVGVVSSIVIVHFPFFNSNSSILTFLGAISYSLYLIHQLVGYKSMGLLNAYFQSKDSIQLYSIIMFVFGLSCSLLSGYLLYRFVEAPAQRLSSKMAYSSQN